MSATTSNTLSPVGSNKRRDRHDPIWLFLVFGVPFLCLASCLVLYLLIEHTPGYLVPETPPIPGAKSWSVIQQRFIQREERRISIWQGETSVCEAPSDACTDLSAKKILEQTISQYDEKKWEMIWSDHDWRSYRCHDPELVNHKVDVVIRSPGFAPYPPTLCVGVERSSPIGFQIMVTTFNPSFLSGWE